MNMSCFDTAGDSPPDPWEMEDTGWQGDVHATSDWEVFERHAGPEYWAYKRLAEEVMSRTYWAQPRVTWHRPLTRC